MTASQTIPRGLWLTVAVLWGLFLAGMYYFGHLGLFQARPYLYFTGAAGALLVLLALKAWLFPAADPCLCGGPHAPGQPCDLEPADHGRSKHGQDHDRDDEHEHHHGHDHGSDRDHGHEAGAGPGEGPPAHASPWPVLKAVALVTFILVPPLAGILIPHRSLNALAAVRRGMTMDSSQLLSIYRSERHRLAEMERGYEKLTTLEVLQAAADRPGTKVAVIGFVYRAKGMPADILSVARFKITCCAADATPIAVAVRWPKAADLKNDTWVKVLGTVTRQAVNGRETTLINADEVIEVETPDQPYI